ncbi:MAG: preprotein translocase subunit SecG, partial [Wenzhouxiangellaceae bacterium]|nr:preprotein translocase subunit SecG [Wenzhouxiangellaceae bacterium]
MFTTLIIFQVLTAAGLIAVVLVQRGPGATMGAAFGSGASGTVFGSRGAGNFLTRLTSGLAVGFFGISLALAVLAAGGGDADRSALEGSVLEETAPPAGTAAEEDGQQVDPSVDAVIDSLDEPRAEQDGAQKDGGQKDGGQ